MNAAAVQDQMQHIDSKYLQQTVQEEAAPTTISGVAKNLQAFVSQTQSINLEDVANSTTRGDQTSKKKLVRNDRDQRSEKDFNLPKQQQNRQSSEKPKQVRFDIKAGLQHMIKEAHIDLDQVSPRSLSQHNRSQTLKNSIGRTRSKSPKSNVSKLKPPPSAHQTKLAMQYKRGAEQNRKKRHNFNQEQEQREQEPLQTPDFSMLVQQQDPEDNVYQTHSQSIKRQEKMFSEDKQQQHQQTIGTIVRRNDHSQNRQLSHSVSLQSISHAKAGMIVRQRSTSPGEAMSLTRNKENQSMMMNTSALAGQIIKLQNQNKLNNSTTEVVVQPQPQLQKQDIISPKPILRNKDQQPIEQAPIVQGQIVRQRVVQRQQQEVMDPFFQTVWQAFKLDSKFIEQKIKTMTSGILNNIKEQLHQKLDKQEHSQQHINTYQVEKEKQIRLALIRQNLGILYKEKFYYDILEISEVREKLASRKKDLKLAMKDNMKLSASANPLSALKMEILSDICSRLTQKLTLKALQLNSTLKQNLHQLFQLYYHVYVAKPIMNNAVTFMKTYTLKQRDKKQYQYYVQRQISEVKIKQVFLSWKNIKHNEEQESNVIQEARSIIYSRKLARVLTGWKIAIIEQRNQYLNLQIIEQYHKYKYYHRLFVRWVNAFRQTSKIKRKAAMLVSQSSNAMNAMYGTLSQDDWLKQAIQKGEEIFHAQTQDMVLEKEHNTTFIESLKFKTRIEELNDRFPQHVDIKKHKPQGFIQEYNNQNIYSKFPQLKHSPKKTNSALTSKSNRFESPKLLASRRNSQEHQDPLELKYSIHSALVHQQNSQKKQQLSHSFSQQLTNQLDTPSNTGGRIIPSQHRQLLPPVPQRIIQQQQQQKQLATQKAVAPNMFFEKLERQIASTKKDQQFSNYIDKHSLVPLVLQVREHIQQLKQNLNVLQSLPADYHFSVSLKQITGTQEDAESYYGISDYMQYAIQSDSSRMAFIQLFKQRVLSKLFTQWKTKFLKQWLRNDLKQYNTLSIAKTSLLYWSNYGRLKQQRALDFSRTKTMQKFYRLFRKWNSANRNLIHDQINKLRTFRKKIVFQVWVRYMERQGHLLQKILRSQQYYQQALMSKALLALYQFYLKQIRIKRFLKRKVFKKFFKKRWLVKYRQVAKLRAVTSKINEKVQLQERLRYQQQFEIMKDVMNCWKARVNDRVKLIKRLTALNHYKQSLISRSFMAFKQVSMLQKGIQRLEYVIRNSCLNPAFQRIKRESKILVTHEQDWIKYRQKYLLQRIVMKWRESIIKKQLVKMMIKKRILKNWKRYTVMRNHVLPLEYREKKLKALFINELKQGLKQKWTEQRADIIIRSMQRKRIEKRMKLCFLKLLENILVQKKKRIINSTVTDFKSHNLREKAFQTLKLRWVKRSKKRMMNKVAKDFHQKIMKRRYLRQKQFFQDYGFSHNNLSEDQMLLQRVLTQWRMFYQDTHRKHTVLDRFLSYKRNLMKLRCFLGWKSIVQYEQSINSSIVTRNFPVQQQTQQSSSKYSTQMGYINTELSKMPTYDKAYAELMQQQPIPSESPYKVSQMRGISGGGQSDKKGDHSLFDELENIFSKNKKWLDEQREREEFLREMAAHYNQRLSHEMSTLLYSTERLQQQNNDFTKKDH